MKTETLLQNHTMLIIVDKKIPEEAKQKLSEIGELVELETKGITNDYISGHIDIFFCNSNNQLVIAPNIPQGYINILDNHNINYTVGKQNVSHDYPKCAPYNAVITENLLIHKLKITDQSILNSSHIDTKIDIKQGLTRCSLLAIDNNNFITSDKGIEKKLSSIGKNILYVNSQGIILPGMEYGFFGGTCGILNYTVYFLGNLNKFPEGDKVKEFITALGYKIVELCDTKLFDGGGILFLE